MRYEEIRKSNKELPTKCSLGSPGGRELATVSVLTDISETLAILCDMYAVSHGITISRQEGNDAVKQ